LSATWPLQRCSRRVSKRLFVSRYTLCSLVTACAFLAGCGDLLSLHALYTKADQVFDPALEGNWQSADNSMSVKREGDLYEVLLQSRPPMGEPTKFELHLLDIRGVRFADLEAADQIGHMILRVRLTEGKLHVAFLDSEWLRQQVPHDDADIELGRKQAMLTVSTPQLKTLVAIYAMEDRAYDKEIVFERP
jgi:hypothetical protein